MVRSINLAILIQMLLPMNKHMMGTLLNNNKARLRFNIDDGKATMYKQTLMSKIEPAKGDNNPKKQVITPRKAIESLYFNRY